MIERPILFSGAMIRALLNGTKTQTRRIVKPRLDESGEFLHAGSIALAHKQIAEWRQQEGTWFGLAGFTQLAHTTCPYGQQGDRLWVRENFYYIGESNETFFQATNDSNKTPPLSWGGPWKPSIHMPRKLCRIELEITNVRLERLQSMSIADLCEEGIGELLEDPDSIPGRAFSSAEHLKIGGAPLRYAPEIYGFAALWDSLNGAGAWDSNPWVWCLSFKVIKP